ncbi:MAG: cysteine synthase A [Bacteroidota bacterium]
MIYKNITETIGKTPLVEIYSDDRGTRILAKLEYFNPGGSVKDRIALAMIDDAEKKGLLNKDSVIIEPTSGNTGIGLALVAAAKGYKVIFTLPESMSVERRKVLEAYGAELVLTPASGGMRASIAKAEEIAGNTKNSFMPQQFLNPSNPDAHRRTTALEIWEDTKGSVDVFISGVGTGGTITGVSEILKQKKQSIEVIAVEPEGSPVLSGGKPGQHKIQGIGAGFIPNVLNTDIYNEVVTVVDEDAINASRKLARNNGIFVGISSGAALHIAYQKIADDEYNGKKIVVLLPDTGERYLSML